MNSATDPWSLSATEALARFRTKELSPVEYLEALIGRITAEDERINAVTEVAEEAVTRPLLGLPVIAKEKHAIAGRSLTQGLIHERETMAGSDAAIIARIREAGGFVHARATSPEFSCATITHSPMWG